MSAGIAVSAGSGPLTARPAWTALEAHYQQVRDVHLRSLFKDDPNRGERLTAEAAGAFRLAEESGLRARIDAMFAGDKIPDRSGAFGKTPEQVEAEGTPSTPSTSGAWSWERRWPSASSPSSRVRASRSWDTTAQPTT